MTLKAQPEEPFMSVWTVYYDPSDFPGKYVVRRHDLLQHGRTRASDEHYVSDSLDGVRKLVPRGMVRCIRSEGDDAKIVETWL